MNYFRLILALCLFLSIVSGWWLLALILGIIGTWLFPWYVEIIVAGVIYDSLFGHLEEMGVWSYAGTILSVVILIMIRLTKKYIRK